MRRYLVALTTTMLAATLMASCTTDKTGGATRGGSTTPASQPAAKSGAPQVGTPLKTDRYQPTPCDALTQAQVDHFIDTGVTPEPNVDSPGGPMCLWARTDGSGANISVIFSTTGKGLDRIYNGQGTAFKLFRPMDAIQGYPAVAYGVTDDGMTSGDCTVAVGASDTSTIDVGATIFKQNIGQKDPCDAAYQVAMTIVGNIKGGN